MSLSMSVRSSRSQNAGSWFRHTIADGGLGAGEGEGGRGEAAVGGCIGGDDPAIAPLRSDRNMQSLP